VARFSAEPLSGSVPLTVTFSNESLPTVGVDGFEWDFGDGITDTITSPMHVYDTTGVYTVVLTVRVVTETDTLTRTGYITVTGEGPAAPVADFTAEPLSGGVPLTVTFTNESSGEITAYGWAFGDGMTDTITHPVHVYTTTGVYTVSLTAIGPGGTDTLTRTNYITATEAAQPPVADFTASPTSGTVPLTVTFTNTTSGEATDYLWDYGDLITSTTSAVTHTHVYTASGIYTVSLTATGPGGSDTLTRTEYIEALPAGGGSSLQFDGVDDFVPTVNIPSSAEFTVEAWVKRTVDADDYAIFVADINSGYNQAMLALYVDHDNDDCSGANDQFAYYQAGEDPIFCSGMTAELDTWYHVAVSRDSNGTRRFFVDGILRNTESDVASPQDSDGVLTFGRSGHYDGEYFGGLLDEIRISNVAVYLTNFTPPTVPLSSDETTIGLWHFDEGAGQTVADSSGHGRDGVLGEDSEVGPDDPTWSSDSPVSGGGPLPPVADFTAEPLSGSVPLTVTFTNTTSGEATGYEWDYGDLITGTTSAVTHTHVYTASGVYTVSLTASGVYTVSLTASGPGGTDTLTKTDYITATAPEVVETRVISYTYDPLYRLSGAYYSTGESFEYVYDAVGNRLVMTTSNGSTSYEYDVANRLTNVNGVAYTWDDNGNLLSDGVFTYTYDAANRMYTYTGDGLRVAQSVSGVETAFTWDLAAGLAQVLSTSDGVLYLHGLDLIAEQRSGDWWYPLGDALGGVRQWTDDSGSVTYAGGYTPFGVELWREGSTASAWGYTGKWWDADAALLYLRARWYAPGVGRFTQRDVWAGDWLRPQSLHAYVYVENNAVNLTDPTGMSWAVPPEWPNHRDLTYWLYDELHENANGYYVQRIHTLWTSKDPADKSRALAAFYLLEKDKAKWDFKHRIDKELGRSIVLRHSNGYSWYEYSVPGNIHFGFVGRAAGFSGSLLHGGAGIAEIRDPAHVEAGEACCPVYCRFGWIGPVPYAVCIPLGCYYVNPAWWRTAFDEPGDWQNVEFGVQLYDTHKAQMTLEQFEDFLATNGSMLTPAPTTPTWYWVNSQERWPYEVGHFAGPEAGQNERWIQMLLGTQR
jgi:RHS repeat-associated protein